MRLHCSFGRLPFEMLGEIAAHAVEMGETPWTPSAVCKAWRNACLGSPKIWNGLRLVVPRKSTPTPRYSAGKQNCLTLSDLDAALSRSSVAPLHIEFQLRPPYWGSIARRGNIIIDITDITDNLIKRLSSEQNKARWSSFTVEYDPDSLPCDISSAFGGSFPVLEHVAFDCVPPSLLKALEHAPNLKTAKMRDIQLDEVSDGKWIGRLTELTLDRSFCNTLLLKCSNRLTILSLHHNRISSFSDPNPINFPNVRELYIFNCEFGEWIFEIPSIEKLVIHDVSFISMRLLRDQDLKSLREVQWSGDESNCIITSIKTPYVHSMKIHLWSGNGQSLEHIWGGDNRTCVPTHKLSTQYSGRAGPENNSLANGKVFRLLPELRELNLKQLIELSVLKEFGKQVTKGEGKSVCPGLERLDIDLRYLGGCDRVTCREVLHGAGKAGRLRSVGLLESDSEWEWEWGYHGWS
jgi:hypothetical protein